jgi:hypothetical protein
MARTRIMRTRGETLRSRPFKRKAIWPRWKRLEKSVRRTNFSITAFLTVVMAFLINMMGTEFRGKLSLA